MQSLFLLPAFLLATSSFAQNGTQSPGQEQTIILKSENQPAYVDTLAGQTIEHCESMINAIDIKVAFVQTDPVQTEKALANGWFDRMAKNRERYVATKKALEQRNATKK